MAKYHMYSVFVDLNPDDDYMQIPIIHQEVQSMSEKNAVRLVLCMLACNPSLNENNVKVTVVKTSWKTKKVRCEIKTHHNNGECNV